MSEPEITVQAYHVSAGSNLPITRVVIHATCPGLGFPAASQPTQAHATAEYFTSPNSGGSAHYIEDPAHEEHCVHDDAIAWHAPPNTHSIGIELCGEASYTRAQWLSSDVLPVLKKGAARTAELCTRFKVPVRKIGPADLLNGAHGICGHVDVSQAWHESTHTDPGPNFPWDVFMEYVHENLPSTTVQHNPFPAPTRTLRLASPYETGNDVRWVQWAVGVSTDGVFGPNTDHAVRSFQSHHSLAVDGIVGPNTRTALSHVTR